MMSSKMHSSVHETQSCTFLGEKKETHADEEEVCAGHALDLPGLGFAQRLCA